MYKILSSSHLEGFAKLESEVKQHLLEGWELIGGPFLLERITGNGPVKVVNQAVCNYVWLEHARKKHLDECVAKQRAEQDAQAEAEKLSKATSIFDDVAQPKLFDDVAQPKLDDMNDPISPDTEPLKLDPLPPKNEIEW